MGFTAILPIETPANNTRQTVFIECRIFAA